MSDPANVSSPDVAALARCDRRAWTNAFDQHGGDVYSFIFYLARGNQALAEDLHQDVWLSAIARIQQFSPDRGDLRTWLMAIAGNRVAQHYRRQHGRRTVASSDLASQVEAGDRDFPVLPEDLLEQVERRDVVRASLVLLPRDAREALIAKYVDGSPVNEIAARTGRSPKAIESLLTRARAHLRKSLDWYFSTPQGEERK